MTPRVAVVTNIVPGYRADFYRRVLADERLDCEVFCQAEIAGTSLKTEAERLGPALKLVSVTGLAGERLAWQCLPFRELARRFDVCFVYGNPRVLSNVVLAFWLRMRGVEVVIWGQAHTAGAAGISESLRLAWWRRFRNLFLYMDHEVAYLRGRGFTDHYMVGMNNGLNQDALETAAAGWDEDRLAGWRRRHGLDGRRLLLSCARLVEKNAFDLGIDALQLLQREHPDLCWCIIGSGPEQERLAARARAVGVADSIRWVGAVYEEDSLAPWFMSADLLLHPGAIGLTLLHAFGYGLPVVTHDDAARQMPEFAAFQDGETGLAFRCGDAADLAEKLQALLGDKALRSACAAAARRIATGSNNTAVMAQRFAEMALALTGKRSARQQEQRPA